MILLFIIILYRSISNKKNPPLTLDMCWGRAIVAFPGSSITVLHCFNLFYIVKNARRFNDSMTWCFKQGSLSCMCGRACLAALTLDWNIMWIFERRWMEPFVQTEWVLRLLWIVKNHTNIRHLHEGNWRFRTFTTTWSTIILLLYIILESKVCSGWWRDGGMRKCPHWIQHIQLLRDPDAKGIWVWHFTPRFSAAKLLDQVSCCRYLRQLVARWQESKWIHFGSGFVSPLFPSSLSQARNCFWHKLLWAFGTNQRR